jgi:putative ABC transport system permease protein
LRYYSGLSILALAGIILAVGLVTSSGFFAQAVDQVMLDRELSSYTAITRRPPFAARVFAASSREVPLTVARAETLGTHVADTLATEVGLPLRSALLTADSGKLRLTPPNDSRYSGTRRLGDVALVYMSQVEANISPVEGAALAPAVEQDAPATTRLPVWMHATFGQELGVQIGDRFNLPAGNTAIPIEIAGLWEPTDPSSPFWLNDPNQTMLDKLLVTRADYIAWVEPNLAPAVRTATWQVVLDETHALPADAHNYKLGFERAANIIPRYLPDARITAPTLTLEKFVGQQTALTSLLLGFNIPGLIFLLYFLVLTSAVIAYWQRRETSLLRSRGIASGSILNFTVIEAALLFLIGAPLGLALGIGLARSMGYATSFLTYTARAPLPVSVNGINLTLTLGTLGVVLLAKLWTTAATARDTIVTQTREHARPPQGPFWYRNYLDLILVVIAFYAYQQFARRGSLGALVPDQPSDLYQDPLLILAPGILIIALALLAMRAFPLLMAGLDRLAHWTGWMPGYLALRQLGRQSHAYINPLLLVIVALALGVYTLSMAASMDRWLQDRVFHQIGADLAFSPYSEGEAMGEPEAGADWIPPIDEFSLLPGVTHAARMGRYPGELMMPTGSGIDRIETDFLAIDRIDFPLTAWFRNDYARESLGGLMNRLALTPNGILVSQALVNQYNLRIGDSIELLVIPDFGLSVRDRFTIVGIYDYFPTVEQPTVTQSVTDRAAARRPEPTGRNAVIGNMDYIISFFGVTMPHRIWLNLAPDAQIEAVLDAVATTGVKAVEVKAATTELQSEQAQLARVGVFGTLTVGFLAAALMAVLGLLTYSYASLHERLYLFSVLRAVGLRRGEIVGQVALEYAMLTTYGAIAGVACGTLAARMFVPLFRTTLGNGALLPPILPILAREQVWPLVILFSLVMIGLELLIISTAFYRRLDHALRMGHQG